MESLQIPQTVQCQQSGCRIGRAAAHAGLRGDRFVHANVGALCAARGLLQRAGGAHSQVVRGQGHVSGLRG